MAVPDTDTFSLQDVVDEINPTTDDLQDCFNDAIAGNFDPTYEGAKDRLLNFRNYGANTVKLGYYYSGYTASLANFAPTGWRVPTLTDINNLVTALGGASVAGGKLKENSLTYWDSPNTGANNSSLMTLRGSGVKQIVSDFDLVNQEGYITTQTVSSGDNFHCLITDYLSASTVITGTFAQKFLGMPVRLIKTDSADPGTMTDYEGNIYPTITIGSQVWVAVNWKSGFLNDGTPIVTRANNSEWTANAGSNPSKCALNFNESNV
jgi:uncharacterized protein (TIGR02145 family)